MLQQMRDWFRYLKWLLLIIVVMFIWWAINVWGGGGFRERPVAANWAARVNGTEIAAESFLGYARRLDSTYQSLLGDQYAQQRAFLRLGEMAINDLVDEELAHQEATRLGLRATPQEVAEAITRDPNFQESGRFIGLDRYRNLFRGGRLSLEEYEEGLRRGLVISKFRSLVEDGVSVSDREVEQEFLRRNSRQTVEYLLIDAAKPEAGPSPAEASITRWYEQHRDRYSSGPGRRGLYVLIGAGDRAGAAAVTDQEIQEAYQRGLAGRFTIPDRRRASHILFKADPSAPEATVRTIETRARGVLKRARAGADFAALAKQFSEDGTAQAGGDLNFFARGQMVKEFEEAAWSLPVGGISDLVRSPFGFHIIKVTGSEPGRTVTLDEARDALREEILQARARAEAAKRATDLARAASGGALETVARSQGLTVADTGPVHDGEALPGLAASQAVVARMMSLKPGDVSEPIPVPTGQVVVQVTGTIDPEPRPLAEVRDRVVRDLQDEAARARVERELEKIRRTGGGLRALARALRTEIKSQADLAPGAPLPGVPPSPAVAAALRDSAPSAVTAPIVTSAGVLVVSVKERNEHREELAGQRDSVRDGLVRQQQDRLYRAVLQELRRHGDVSINETLVRSLDRA